MGTADDGLSVEQILYMARVDKFQRKLRRGHLLKNIDSDEIDQKPEFYLDLAQESLEESRVYDAAIGFGVALGMFYAQEHQEGIVFCEAYLEECLTRGLSRTRVEEIKRRAMSALHIGRVERWFPVRNPFN
jgi:hypothetical protein